MVDTPSDRPATSELLEAIREFLERDVMPLDSRTGFHARVARNALAMIQRDLELGPKLDADCRTKIGHLVDDFNNATCLRDLERELVRGIRSGKFDDQLGDVATYVRESVAAKLRISNPNYFIDQESS